MEITGSGGILLLIVAVLWLGFMTPSGKRGLADRKPKRNRQRNIRITNDSTAQNTRPVTPRQASWYQASTATADESLAPIAKAPAKVVINRLPDPLSARLGKIETVQWAQVHELEDVRKEKEQLSSENLDEILRRRRSNG
ncbi:MAG: hypothetical protein EBT65_02370 [Actinobacteria bacterium]|jgi:hypothetical protein|nr:hypothetical protein [Actinomycetota bacterium]